MSKKKFTQLAENIWLWPHNPDFNAVQSSVGVIVDKNETVLVDTGNSPNLARKIKGELKRHGFPAVSRIIYTHHHWDHVSGACEFQVPVVAHTKCRAILIVSIPRLFIFEQQSRCLQSQCLLR